MLVTIGTADASYLDNRALETKMKQERYRRVTFRFYKGLSPNFFKIGPNGQEDWNEFHWDDVAKDRLKWLKRKD